MLEGRVTCCFGDARSAAEQAGKRWFLQGQQIYASSGKRWDGGANHGIAKYDYPPIG